MKSRRHAAFTLMELLVASCLSSLVGLIVYGVASEGLVDFARNTSINRSYSNARQSIDRISIAMQSAGHTPLLVDATGADITTATTGAGIRFWRYSSTPLYYVNTPALTDTTLTVSLIKPGTISTLIPAPAAGDMITVALLGFQARVVSVNSNGNNATLTFASSVASNTQPTLTANALATATAAAAATNGGEMTCLDWNSVAFIAINNQLRYFPKFISGTTSVTTAANYQVLTYLMPAPTGTTATTTPFSLGPTPSINVDLYAQAPDYSNRVQSNTAGTTGTYNLSTGVNTANTNTYLQTALAPRNAALLHTPY